MHSRRTAKVSQAIREAVSMAILLELRDPRIQNVTVTRAEVSSDLQNAKVYVSVMGDEKQENLCLHGLNSARGFLQSKVADRMKTRYTPILRFEMDRGVKHSLETTRILNELFPEENSPIEDELDVSEAADEQGDVSADDETESD